MEQKPVKEIDFLPEWYKAGRKRKVSYKRQYTAITSLFMVLVVWSFVVDHSASIADAKIKQRRNFIGINQGITSEYNQIKSELQRLKAKADLLDKLSPTVNFAHVVAELSFVVNENIMLSLLDIVAEEIEKPEVKPTTAKAVVKLGSSVSASDEAITEADYRFKVTIAGIAAGAPEVATLISRLESSPYFCNIVPGFSKTKEIDGYLVTEFEISCFVANYVLQK